jgi:glutamine amidotransferase/cyclase
MLNCIDMDGQGNGYDLQLIRAVQASVTVPVIASSGAGAVTHFSQVYRETDVAAALAAGIFHRNEVRIGDVKSHLISEGIPARN